VRGSSGEDSRVGDEAPRFRLAGPGDAGALANLHAESWRRHYRGAYSDVFLDGDVLADRLALWSERLREPNPGSRTILAEDRSLVGFAHTVFEDDPTWGALLENMHVVHSRKRRGIGSRLLGLTAAAVMDRGNGTGLYLWVLEQNVDARAFYEARGGSCVGRELVTAPGGIASRLTGSPVKLRYAWPEPSVLLEPPPPRERAAGDFA
jgi:GNAT superfamily N-acetyltransferase